mmetsp:Transcript_100477/g.216726  ORF Transcript_100477/g.216726 Transcript_100477/m.216726 type:complete len:108 (-) Transcript_100477:1890-2213(-)
MGTAEHAARPLPPDPHGDNGTWNAGGSIGIAKLAGFFVSLEHHFEVTSEDAEQDGGDHPGSVAEARGAGDSHAPRPRLRAVRHAETQVLDGRRGWHSRLGCLGVADC